MIKMAPVQPFAALQETAPSKAAQFRARLASPELSFLMEAHNGLSAKIVEEAGFKGIWASGLAISSALGLRDSNEASWTQILEVLEFMSDSTSIPILLDGDTGYGNFNNFRRLVVKLCQRNIAAVCIEDKLFPKTNSFIGERQPLADIEEFSGKIQAGKDSQFDPDFSIIARVEALIAGWGLDEALKRAEAYVDAGADGILIHSKKSDAGEIQAFAKEWAGRAPLVIVPTTYYAAPTEQFRRAGISMVIWANHNLRASLSAMRDTSRRIFEEQSLTGVEGRIASMRELFDIDGNRELISAEGRYLARRDDAGRAIVLAASRGRALGPLTEDRPKCMLEVGGKPILRRIVGAFNDSGLRDITVVRGYKKEAVDLPTVETVDNDAYAGRGEVASLACASGKLTGNCVLSFGDIVFRKYILDQLLAVNGDIILTVDALWGKRTDVSRTGKLDLAQCTKPFTGDFLDDEPVYLRRIDGGADPACAHGRWVGLARFSDAGCRLVVRELDAMRRDGSLKTAPMATLFNRLVAAGHKLTVLYIAGHWIDVNDVYDLADARDML
ncbi:MAG: phosphoenolpyruvate mutase [Sphingomonadales bacterium]